MVDQDYINLYEAAQFFNEKLFGGRLTLPRITVFQERGCYGSFAHEYLQKRGGEGKQSVINLNPQDFDRREELVLSTLVHELTHLEQAQYGEPSKNGYHNRAWVKLMERVGLIPVNNKDASKQTGLSVTHHILEGGPFHVAVNELLATGWSLEWREIERDPQEVARALAQRKVAYHCPTCGTKVWGKPNLDLACGCDYKNSGKYLVMETA